MDGRAGRKALRLPEALRFRGEEFYSASHGIPVCYGCSVHYSVHRCQLYHLIWGGMQRAVLWAVMGEGLDRSLNFASRGV